MKFQVWRSSGKEPSFENIVVTKEAYYEPELISKQLVHDIVGLTYTYRTKDWFGQGRNHKDDGDFLQRDWPKTTWVCEIDSLEELIEAAKEEDLIIRSEFREPQLIEIYDDYIE